MKETNTASSLSRGRARAFFTPTTGETEAPALPLAAEARAHRAPSPAAPEESLVVDDRSDLTPAQMVEGKLMDLLRGGSLAVSHLQMKGLLRGRWED